MLRSQNLKLHKEGRLTVDNPFTANQSETTLYKLTLKPVVT